MKERLRETRRAFTLKLYFYFLFPALGKTRKRREKLQKRKKCKKCKKQNAKKARSFPGVWIWSLEFGVWSNVPDAGYRIYITEIAQKSKVETA